MASDRKRSNSQPAPQVKQTIKGRNGDRPTYIEDESSGCWLCTGASQGDGYAMLNQRPAHRVAYETFFGKLSAGDQVHHLCYVRNCINPEHLVAVSRKDHNKIHRFHRRFEQ